MRRRETSSAYKEGITTHGAFFCMRLLFPFLLKKDQEGFKSIGRLHELLSYAQKGNKRRILLLLSLPMRRRETSSAYSSYQIFDLIEPSQPSLYAELVFYAEKGKQAPHTRKGCEGSIKSKI